MPVDVRASGTDRQPVVVVSPSAAIELYWVTAGDGEGGLRLHHPSLDALAASGIPSRLGGLWGAGPDASPTARSLPELLVLAERAGVLTATDLDAVVAGAAEAASSAAPAPALASETPEDRAMIVERLARLASRPELRREWAGVLGEAAAAVDEHWHGVGLDISRRAVRARDSQLPWLDDGAAVAAWASGHYGGLLPDLIGRAAAEDRPVLVVPSYWSGRGAMYDLAGYLLVGIPAQPGATDARARTEPVVRGVKALADPTRLALLAHLSEHPRTVGELAADFGLAQPTVSRHIRLLRDAGLVTDARQGGATLVRVDRPAVDGLLRRLGAALDAPAG